MKKNLLLVKFGWLPDELMEFLRTKLLEHFAGLITDVSSHKKTLRLPSHAHDFERDQYLANDLIEELIIIAKKRKSFRTLGITRADLYTEDYNFIFGMAESHDIPGPKVAVISTCRLSNEFWNEPYNKDLFHERTIKEAIHELGHTFGLKHCSDNCIMRFSNSILDTDAKPKTFCAICQKKLYHVK
ncbi:MAG: archaemetzincin family Zn-dependent metalloprotease [Candidatus Helarchaeota archaeon]